MLLSIGSIHPDDRLPKMPILQTDVSGPFQVPLLYRSLLTVLSPYLTSKNQCEFRSECVSASSSDTMIQTSLKLIQIANSVADDCHLGFLMAGSHGFYFIYELLSVEGVSS